MATVGGKTVGVGNSLAGRHTPTGSAMPMTGIETGTVTVVPTGLLLHSQDLLRPHRRRTQHPGQSHASQIHAGSTAASTRTRATRVGRLSRVLKPAPRVNAVTATRAILTARSVRTIGARTKKKTRTVTIEMPAQPGLQAAARVSRSRTPSQAGSAGGASTQISLMPGWSISRSTANNS